MIQRASGAFRVNQNFPAAGLSTSVADSLALFAAGASVWSGGATIIELLALEPVGDQDWSLLGFSVNATMIMVYPYLGGGNGAGMYGKLGKIIAGVVPGSAVQTTPGSPGVPWVTPILPLPLDASLLAPLWDPAVDPLPPALNPVTGVPTTGLPASVTMMLPTPLLVSGGTSFGIGIWMLPSLVGTAIASNGALVVQRANYTVVYDDGKPTPAPL